MSSFKKLQKLFAVLLVFTFMAGLVTVPNAAYAARREPMRNLDIDVKKLISDIEDETVKDAVLKLNAFGIIDGMEDGKYHPETKLTREQFAKILVTALKMDHAAQAGVGYKSFPDVPADRWSAGFVGVAAGQGLIQGYPDGTFKPTKEVSYAEAVTMLVRALGYKDEFLPGAWPGNYLAKAAEKDITKKVKFSDASGIVDRGDAAILVNNTMDAKVVKVDTYEGSVVKYYESEKTLLEDRLDITKAEDARIVATKRVDDGLKWEEVKVYFRKDVKVPDTRDEYKFKKDDLETFEVVKGYNPEELLGEEVTVYLNDDDEVVYAESEYDDKVNFDYVEEIKGDNDNRLKLVKFDDDYPFAEDAYVYFKASGEDKVKNHARRYDKDDKRVDLGDVKYEDLVGKVGKFVVKNNEIVWAEIMQSTEADPWFVVMKNDNGFLTGICADNEEHEVDLRKDEDYDGIIVLGIDGEELEVDDLEKGDIIYVQKQELDSDDYAVVRVVKDNVKEGKLERVKNDRIMIDDKEIKVVKYKKYDEEEKKTITIYDAYYSVDDGEDVKQYRLDEDEEVDDDMEDADGEDIIAYTDAVGRIAYFQTATGTTSGYKYGVVTKVYKDGDRIKVFTISDKGDDDEISYELEEEKNLRNARLLDEYGKKYDDNKYRDEDKENYHAPVKEGSAIKFKLNKDGEIAEDKLYVMNPNNLWALDSGEDFGKDYLPKATRYKSYEKFSGDKDNAGAGIKGINEVETRTFAVDDKVVIIDAETFKFTDNPEYKSKDDVVKIGDELVADFDSGEFGAANWKDLKEANGIDGYFYVFADDNRESNAKAVIFIGKGSGAASDDEMGIYVINTHKKAGDRYIKYHAYEGEVEEKELDDEDLFSGKERPYIAKVKSSGKIAIVRPKDSKDGFGLYKGIVEKKDASSMTVRKIKAVEGSDDLGSKKTFNISNRTVVYEEDTKKTTSSIKTGDVIFFVTEKDTNVRVIERLIDSERTKALKELDEDINDPGDSDKDEKTGVVTYINEAKTAFEVDNKTIYTITSATVLKDAKGNTIALGLEAGEKLNLKDVVDVDGNVITIKESPATDAEKALEDAKTALKDAIAEAKKLLPETIGEDDEAATALNTAIEAAEAKLVAEDATVETLKAALTSLNTAVEDYEEAVEEAKLEAALTAVNTITGKATDIQIIKENAEVLGLDLTSFNKLDDETGQPGGRQTAVMIDLKANMPEGGYDLATLQKYFDSIVAVRTATQTSMDMVNNATELNDIEYVEILLDAFKNAEHPYHGSTRMTEKIREMQELVEKFNALGKADKATVLKKVIDARPEGGFLRSSATTDALREAIDKLNPQSQE